MSIWVFCSNHFYGEKSCFFSKCLTLQFLSGKFSIISILDHCVECSMYTLFWAWMKFQNFFEQLGKRIRAFISFMTITYLVHDMLTSNSDTWNNHFFWFDYVLFLAKHCKFSLLILSLNICNSLNKLMNKIGGFIILNWLLAPHERGNRHEPSDSFFPFFFFLLIVLFGISWTGKIDVFHPYSFFFSHWTFATPWINWWTKLVVS